MYMYILLAYNEGNKLAYAIVVDPNPIF